MGKGVTKNALVSLLHLSHEMMAGNKDKASVYGCVSDCLRRMKRFGIEPSTLFMYLFLKSFFLFGLCQDFISQWSLGNEAAAEDASASQLGLAWLIPLWVDRDQEVWTVCVFSLNKKNRAH